MLHLLNNTELRLYLCPEFVSAVLIKKGFYVTIEKKHIEKIVNPDDTFSILKNVIALFSTTSQITLILSSYFYRPFVIPWHINLKNSLIIEQMAHILFEKNYTSEIVDHYEFIIDTPHFGHAIPAIAIEKKHLTLLKSAHKNIQIIPNISIVWNHFFSQTHQNIALIEQHREIFIEREHNYIKNIYLKPFLKEKFSPLNTAVFGAFINNSINELKLPSIKQFDATTEYEFSYNVCGVI